MTNRRIDNDGTSIDWDDVIDTYAINRFYEKPAIAIADRIKERIGPALKNLTISNDSIEDMVEHYFDWFCDKQEWIRPVGPPFEVFLPSAMRRKAA